MTIMDYERCPHCGSNYGYYQRMYVSGWIQETTLFEKNKFSGERKSENTEMWDSMNYSRFGKYYYCTECNRKICKVI